jgi:hypothetical protein
LPLTVSVGGNQLSVVAAVVLGGGDGAVGSLGSLGAVGSLGVLAAASTLIGNRGAHNQRGGPATT